MSMSGEEKRERKKERMIETREGNDTNILPVEFPTNFNLTKG